MIRKAKSIGIRLTSALTTILLLYMCACTRSIDNLNTLASVGKIEDTAPVKAEIKMRIAAPPAVVWALLVNAPAWPQWNHEISEVKTLGPLEPRERFSWQTGGTTIQSQVQLFEPERRLAWTGTAFTARAVHLWELTPSGNNQTDVTVKESMSGFLIKQLFPSSKLMESDKEWLTALKRAAELHSQAEPGLNSRQPANQKRNRYQ